MKKLPASWTKNKEGQLSFAESLFSEPTRSDIFFENFRQALKNSKFFRFRLQKSTLPRGEREGAYYYWSEVLELGVKLLLHAAKKTNKHFHITEQELMTELFIDRIDWTVMPTPTRRELLEHHDNASNKIIGMLLEYKTELRGKTREIKLIHENLEDSKKLLHRL